MKICVPITATTIKQALADANQAVELGAELLELRIDYLQDLSPAGFAQLFKACLTPVIVTPRSKEEGGHWELGEPARRDYLLEALELGVDYIDYELARDLALRIEILARRRQTKVILSYHNFAGCPPLAELILIKNEMLNEGADLAKIAVMANTLDDNEIVYQLLQDARSKKQSLIALAMGELGAPTRIKGPQLGSFLTYASLPGKPSAPGQITIGKIQNSTLR